MSNKTSKKTQDLLDSMNEEIRNKYKIHGDVFYVTHDPVEIEKSKNAIYKTTDDDTIYYKPKYILDNCDLLIKEDCVIFEHVLYEKIDYQPDHKYRVFLSTDDYDYVEDPVREKELDKHFNS